MRIHIQENKIVDLEPYFEIVVVDEQEEETEVDVDLEEGPSF